MEIIKELKILPQERILRLHKRNVSSKEPDGAVGADKAEKLKTALREAVQRDMVEAEVGVADSLFLSFQMAAAAQFVIQARFS